MKRKTKIRQIYCPYCDILLKYQGAHRIQLGRYGWLVELWDQLFAGSLDVQLYECPKCGKIEMFRERK